MSIWPKITSIWNAKSLVWYNIRSAHKYISLSYFNHLQLLSPVIDGAIDIIRKFNTYDLPTIEKAVERLDVKGNLSSNSFVYSLHDPTIKPLVTILVGAFFCYFIFLR